MRFHARHWKLMAAGIAATVSCWSVSAPAAVMITFDDYANGEAVNASNPAPVWTGNTGNFTVGETAGVGGSKGLISTATATQNNSVRVSPTDAQYGGSFASDKLVSFTFDVKIPNHSVTTSIYRVFLGTGSSASTRAGIINFRGDGSISVNSGGSASGTGGLLTDGTFHTIYGTLNYANQTWSAYVAKSGGPVTLASNVDFYSSLTAYGAFVLNVQTTAPTTNSVAFDNIGLSVPEPASMAVLAGCGMLLRRKRSR